jgi:hypothetical protein
MRGFQSWLKSSMREFMFDTIKSSNCFGKKIDPLMQGHIEGKKDNGFILWKLLNLAIWNNKEKDIS